MAKELPVIKSYEKRELRALFYNPNLEFKPGWELTAKEIHPKALAAKVEPIIKEYCEGIMTVQQWKNAKVVPPKVVKIIFQKLKSELCL